MSDFLYSRSLRYISKENTTRFISFNGMLVYFIAELTENQRIFMFSDESEEETEDLEDPGCDEIESEKKTKWDQFHDI